MASLRATNALLLPVIGGGKGEGKEKHGEGGN